MSQRLIFDCHDAIAIAYPGSKAQPAVHRGKVHIAPIPRAGVALSLGVHIEGEAALRNLIKACEHALSIQQFAPVGHPFPVVPVPK